MDEWREWMIQTFSEDKSNFVTAERNADGWNFNRFTCNPFTKEITRLQAELAEARESKGRIMIAAAASVKASMDEYKRGHADGVKSGQEKGLDEAANELERLDGFGEWHEAAQAIRALKSPKPQED